LTRQSKRLAAFEVVRLATKPVESMRSDLQAAFKRSSDLTAAIARVLRVIGCNVVLAPEEVDAQVSFIYYFCVRSIKHACMLMCFITPGFMGYAVGRTSRPNNRAWHNHNG
jgi:hypothetical protein